MSGGGAKMPFRAIGGVSIRVAAHVKGDSPIFADTKIGTVPTGDCSSQWKTSPDQFFREVILMSKKDNKEKVTEKLVAVVSPWEKVSALAKRQFRMESLPEEKRVIVWRDDLQSEQSLAAELSQIGIVAAEIRKQQVTDWKQVD
jgi:hypothetical protein